MTNLVTSKSYSRGHNSHHYDYDSSSDSDCNQEKYHHHPDCSDRTDYHRRYSDCHKYFSDSCDYTDSSKDTKEAGCEETLISAPTPVTENVEIVTKTEVSPASTLKQGTTLALTSGQVVSPALAPVPNQVLEITSAPEQVSVPTPESSGVPLPDQAATFALTPGQIVTPTLPIVPDQEVTITPAPEQVVPAS